VNLSAEVLVMPYPNHTETAASVLTAIGSLAVSWRSGATRSKIAYLVHASRYALWIPRGTTCGCYNGAGGPTGTERLPVRFGWLAAA
jgi:hypothetical protein